MRFSFRTLFRPRDLFFHDGAALRHIRISTGIQAATASLIATALGLSVIGTAQLTGAVPAALAAMSRDAQIVEMRHQVAAMRAGMTSLRREAAAHAARLDARQAVLAAAIAGKSGALLAPASFEPSAAAAPIVAPLKAAEGRQAALAARVASLLDARYRTAAANLKRLGVAPKGLAMGGPYEPVDPSAKAQPDPNFRALFQSWKRLDSLQQGIVAIPSQRPVNIVTFTSGFGVRTDPFRGGAAMHAGVDMPGPIGTAIFATADGIVGRAGWANGYGNLVELEHGRGIQTRYGHLSAILVQPGQRVKRGQQIARMGSTGRSTGSHLHYEVRLDGHAVNPMPFLQTANYLATPVPGARVAVGGPVAD